MEDDVLIEYFMPIQIAISTNKIKRKNKRNAFIVL